MVPQNMMRTHEGKMVFSDEKIGVMTALELVKSLKQVKEQRLLLTCAPVYALPSYIRTMARSTFFREKGTNNKIQKTLNQSHF